MDSHGNARTTSQGRMPMVERPRNGWSLAEAARAAEVCARTVRTWRDRHAAEAPGCHGAVTPWCCDPSTLSANLPAT
ncbi:hypothetical protein EXY23_03170 [Roseicella aquatilis]|uniref:Uncharacterized protein n=1 Tax=Roseicella aquatilis TaxID=2527868 RepID=A0A4R4DX34_9PROT|nr:hypothetical protein EXY23_03170 [Roseicella aquatilis]